MRGKIKMQVGKKKDKDPLDRYFTPQPHARAHARRLIEIGLLDNGDRVIDAGCGDAAYIRAILVEAERARLSIQVVGVDLDGSMQAQPWDRWDEFQGRWSIFKGLSFLDFALSERDVVVANPPFTLAEEFIEHSRKARVASFLLQSQFLSGGERYRNKVWRDLTRADPFTQRIKFYGPAIDLINARRAEEGKGPAGGNAVDYSAITFERGKNPDGMDFVGRHLCPVEEE